jgi:hypothetical protein
VRVEALPRLRAGSPCLDKLNRLDWAEALTFRSYGVRIGVRASEPGALEGLSERFPPGWRESSSPVVDFLYSLVVGGRDPGTNVRRLNLAYNGIFRLARERELQPCLDALEADLKLAVAATAPRRIFVHAGVVGFQGRAIVVPGRTFTGKSTLVAALVRAGATYYSDEFAVLDSRGRVHPFSKPLSIRTNGGYEAEEVPVAALGGRAGSRALPVGLIAVAPYKEGTRWRPRRGSAMDGALALLRNALPVRLAPSRVLPTLRQASERALVLKGARGEADAIAESLLARAGSV